MRPGVATQVSLLVKGLAPLRPNMWIKSWWILTLCEDWFKVLAHLTLLDMEISALVLLEDGLLGYVAELGP